MVDGIPNRPLDFYQKDIIAGKNHVFRTQKSSGHKNPQ